MSADFLCNRKLLRNVPITQKRSARIEGFRESEADLSALLSTVSLPAMRVDIYFCNIFLTKMLYC